MRGIYNWCRGEDGRLPSHPSTPRLGTWAGVHVCTTVARFGVSQRFTGRDGCARTLTSDHGGRWPAISYRGRFATSTSSRRPFQSVPARTTERGGRAGQIGALPPTTASPTPETKQATPCRHGGLHFKHCSTSWYCQLQLQLALQSAPAGADGRQHPPSSLRMAAAASASFAISTKQKPAQIRVHKFAHSYTNCEACPLRPCRRHRTQRALTLALAGAHVANDADVFNAAVAVKLVAHVALCHLHSHRLEMGGGVGWGGMGAGVWSHMPCMLGAARARHSTAQHAADGMGCAAKQARAHCPWHPRRACHERDAGHKQLAATRRRGRLVGVAVRRRRVAAPAAPPP